MEVAFNPVTREFWTEDKIRYSPEEYAVLVSKRQKITRQVHDVKKIFKGFIHDDRVFGQQIPDGKLLMPGFRSSNYGE